VNGLETALFATPIFFNVQPRQPPFHLTKGKRDKWPYSGLIWYA
jgi:hypothetical protein